MIDGWKVIPWPEAQWLPDEEGSGMWSFYWYMNPTTGETHLLQNCHLSLRCRAKTAIKIAVLRKKKVRENNTRF